MGRNQDGRDISRRQFGTTLGAVAGLAAGANLLTPAEVSAAPHINPRIIGANDRVVVASIGVRGQGNAVKRGFAKLANVEIKTLCDIDENVGMRQVADKTLADLPTYKPGFEQDLRKVYEDKDVDAVIIATPNHWHALATIWALSAGKHVYVEKPSSRPRQGILASFICVSGCALRSPAGGLRAPAGGVWWQATTTVARSRGGSSRQRSARSLVSRQARTC